MITNSMSGLPTLGLVDDILERPERDEEAFRASEWKKFKDSSRCPECKRFTERAIQEVCGHVKCRVCFLPNENICHQCPNDRHCLQDKKMDLSDEGDDRESRIYIRPPEDISEVPDEEEDLENEEPYTGTEIVYRGDEFLFEIEHEKGKSFAVLDKATLENLGLIASDVDGTISNADENENQMSEDPDTVEQSTSNEEADQETERVDTPTPLDEENIPSDNNDTNDEDYILPAHHNSSASSSTSDTDGSKKTDNKGRQPKISKKRQKPNADHILNIENQGSKMKYKCTKCNLEFKEEYKHRFHVFCNLENGQRPYICKYCSKQFTSRSHFDYHTRQHTGERPYQCHLCVQSFIQKVKLSRHMKTHERLPFPQNYKLYMCAYCKRRFTTLANCKRHCKMHTDERPFECDICNKKFKSKTSKLVHLKIHENNRPHKCQLCPRAFSTAKDLRRHHLCHTGEQPFHCELCKAKFRRKDNLERHIRSTHKLPEKAIKELAKAQAENYEKSKKAETTVEVKTEENQIDLEPIQIIDEVLDEWTIHS